MSQVESMRQMVASKLKGIERFVICNYDYYYTITYERMHNASYILYGFMNSVDHIQSE